MIALEYIDKTREYLDYLERHIKNVEKAWKEIQEKCKDMSFVYDDCKWGMLDHWIENHDISKLSQEEFVPYRVRFRPTQNESPKNVLGQEEDTLKQKIIEENFQKAWNHHIENNDHHWEKWTNESYYFPYSQELHCAHMIVDWLAMSYEFGDSPREYYQKNKTKIKLPDWAIEFIYEIFLRLEK